ncbi:MAG: universal stress protein [Betaproteobacteria bacterium]|nr:universal stress protein [Betaproteobacteria bacterium]
MYKHILLATDGSPLSDEAALHAMHTAKQLDARLTVMTVAPEYHQLLENVESLGRGAGTRKEQFEEKQKERANLILDEVKKAASRYGVRCFSAVAFGDRPYRAILEQAEKSQCDLIVMASHGRRGLKGVLLGSETSKVLAHGRIPVLVCRSARQAK